MNWERQNNDPQQQLDSSLQMDWCISTPKPVPAHKSSVTLAVPGTHAGNLTKVPVLQSPWLVLINMGVTLLLGKPKKQDQRDKYIEI